MRRYLPLFMAILTILTIFSLFFAACNNPVGDDDSLVYDPSNSNVSLDYSNLPQAKAWAYDNTKSEYYEITSALVETGTRCEAWVETSLRNISKSDIQALVKKFDNEIYPRITQAFGNYETIFQDSDSVKLILLILDIKDGYDGVTNKGYIGGYFDAWDLLPESSSNPHPNGAPLLYIDANPQKLNDSGVYMTMAHEFQHLINFANSFLYRIQGTYIYAQDTWINEGLSTAAEYLYMNKHSADRINWFNRDPLGTIAKGNSFYAWRETPSQPDKVLDDYATVYLFFQWLRIHSSDGTGIYKEIGQSSHYDYQAVTKAAAGRLDIDDDWKTLFSTWLAANYQNEPSGLTGYNGEIKTRVWAVPKGTYPLYPGEAVYTMSSQSSSDKTEIKYKHLIRDPVNGPDENNYNSDDTQRALMYNVSTIVIDPQKTTGTLADGRGETKQTNSSTVRSAAGISEPHRVDVWTVRGRTNTPQQIQLSEEANAASFTFKSMGSEQDR